MILDTLSISVTLLVFGVLVAVIMLTHHTNTKNKNSDKQ